jgi:DNA-binding Lrp family transcriptional regulator
MGDNTRNHQSQQEIQAQNTVFSTLTGNSFLQVNRRMMSVLGYRQAIVLSYLIDQWAYLRNAGKLQEDGSFYKERTWIADCLGTGVKDVDSALRILEEKGVISRTRKGLNPEKYYHIDFNAIVEILQSTCSTVRTKFPSGICEDSPEAFAGSPPEELDYIENENKEIDNKESEKARARETLPIPNDIAIGEVQTNVALSPEVLSLASEWSDYVESVGIEPPSIVSIENGIIALRRARNLSDDQLRTVLDFMRHDQFWGLRSPQTPQGLLRKSENGRLIIDNVLGQMRTDKRFIERLLEESLDHVKLNV